MTSHDVNPAQFYDQLKDMKKIDRSKDRLDFPERPEIKLPHFSILNQEPFREEIRETYMEQDVKHIREKQIRHFLQSVLQTQIMKFGRELGSQLYDHVIGAQINPLICSKFGVPH